jgi:hypothetical protein
MLARLRAQSLRIRSSTNTIQITPATGARRDQFLFLSRSKPRLDPVGEDLRLDRSKGMGYQ